MRWTVFRLLLAVAVLAILVHLATDPLKTRDGVRYERCMQVAETHAGLASEYRKNARGDSGMLRIAAWHETMREKFRGAALRTGGPMPRSQPFPPRGWIAPPPGTPAGR